MDTEPIYELRERLRAAGIAGTNLLSEDFRLKRALETFKPLETASPVFAKIGQLAQQFLSPDCKNPQGALLDTMTLVDAVICTLGTVEIQGEVHQADTLIKVQGDVNCSGSMIVNAPYSTLKELLEALTTSGSGHYGYVCDMRENHPELFRDYRVKYALVQALGASYAELADKVTDWLIEDNDRMILPLLYKDFEPDGKKDMVRRLKVIDALAGADANDFYIKMLATAQKDVRTELINALRHEPKNVSLLMDMSKTEKGKNKDKVFELLAEIRDENVYDYFKELAKKKPETALKYLRDTTTDWASELVADICVKVIEKFDKADSASETEKQDISNKIQNVARAIYGKGGTEICKCCRELLARTEGINHLLKETWKKPKYEYEYDILKCGVLHPQRYSYNAKAPDIEAALGKILHHSLILNPDTDMQMLVTELYEGQPDKKANIKFLAAVVTTKFLNDEDCVKWLEEQVTDKALLLPKFSPERMKAVIEAAAYVVWDEKECGYKLWGAHADVQYPDRKIVERPIKLSHAEEIMEWMKKHVSERVDDILSHWVALNDKDMCSKFGEYFYQKALLLSDNRAYLEYMKNCDWRICKNLGVNRVKQRPNILLWELYNWLTMLPGGRDAIMEETRTICEMVKNGKLNADRLKVEDLEIQMDEWSKRD
ncbi:MAG: hypothetical protein K2N73_01710 [Lachnospiraceae bacterium]|nr:hypothetical protein [Lachnospiraceae bacterium]